jgi:putative peptidoglycan lipid II flippase
LVGNTINQRIFRSTLVIAGLTLLVRVIGLAREIAIAGYFGTSDEVDAYLMAFLLPNFVINVLAGSINAAFIPTFVAVRQQQGRDAAHRLLGSVLLATAGLLFVITLLLLGCAPAVLSRLAPGFDDLKLTLTLRLYIFGFLP